jgi:outer membrane immunogenic protein
VHGGWAWGESGPVDLDGWFFGGQLGFNYQAPGSSFVWGGEVDAAFADISGTVVAGVTSKADGVGTLRARGGFTADRTLIYATGGFAWARNEITVAGVSDNQTHTGWTVGGESSKTSGMDGRPNSNIFISILATKHISLQFFL